MPGWNKSLYPRFPLWDESWRALQSSQRGLVKRQRRTWNTMGFLPCLAGRLSVRWWIFTSVSCLSLMCRTEKWRVNKSRPRASLNKHKLKIQRRRGGSGYHHSNNNVLTSCIISVLLITFRVPSFTFQRLSREPDTAGGKQYSEMLTCKLFPNNAE